MLPLLDLMFGPAIERPKTHDDGVVLDPDEEFTLPMPRRKYLDAARIQLHRHTNGLWMWSVSFSFTRNGFWSQVGARDGKFAQTREAALHYAVQELLGYCAEFPNDKIARATAAWARRLK